MVVANGTKPGWDLGCDRDVYSVEGMPKSGERRSRSEKEVLCPKGFIVSTGWPCSPGFAARRDSNDCDSCMMTEVCPMNTWTHVRDSICMGLAVVVSRAPSGAVADPDIHDVQLDVMSGHDNY